MSAVGIDTNLLVYALTAEAPEQVAARAFLDSRRENPDTVLSELALVELYVLLRKGTVVRAPMGARGAADVVAAFRRHPRWRIVDHHPTVMDAVWDHAGRAGFARARIFDVRLALSLQAHGVTEFATRNVKDFKGLGFARVWDPLD